jgi:hypothetical protein
MPIPLPNLDDRSYGELTAEARALIPSLYPDWTNHNPSDPGIVLVELLAWLTEMLLFQINEIPPASAETFLQLLNGPIPTWTRPEQMSLDEAIRQTTLSGRAPSGRIAPGTTWKRPDGMNLDEAIGRTIGELRTRYRAVTPDDYEYIALYAWPQHETARQLPAAGRLRRVRCVARRNLEAGDPTAPAPAHVSLVIVPDPAAGETHPQPSDDLRAKLWSFFEARRVLATRHHVVGPRYVEIGVAANLALHDGAPPAATLEAARLALAAFFDPLTGGPDGAGWPFGRAVYISEVYAVLEAVHLVNYVEDVQLTGPRPIVAEDGSTVGIRLDAHELVQLTTPRLVAYDTYGEQYIGMA